jgi:uncharacterized protein (DUF1697 family)
VNVGRNNRIAMADLRRVLGSLDGVEVVGTHLASGNGIVRADDPSTLATRVERALVDGLGLGVRVLVRTGVQLEAVVAGNPFPAKAAEQPKMLHVAFLEEPVDPAAVQRFGFRHGQDEIGLGPDPADELYLCYETTSYDSPINKVLAGLGGVATTRNWNTVLTLRDMTAG